MTTGRHRLRLAARLPKAPPATAGADDNSGTKGRKGTGPWVQYVKFSWASMGPVQAWKPVGVSGACLLFVSQSGTVHAESRANKPVDRRLQGGRGSGGPH